VKEAIDGDTAAGNELISRLYTDYRPFMDSILKNLPNMAVTPNEIIDDALVDLFKAIKAGKVMQGDHKVYRNRRGLLAFLGKILSRKASKALDKHNKSGRVEKPGPETLLETVAAKIEMPEEIAALNDAIPSMRRYLESRRDFKQSRRVRYLRIFDSVVRGQSGDEIQAEEGISNRTYNGLLREISKLVEDWHGVGTALSRPAVPAVCLRALGEGVTLIPPLNFLRKIQLN